MKISILIPTYNSDATLAIALGSIANQTYYDFEVLIIDGMSTDKTLEIAESYTTKMPSLRIFSEKDQGIYDAMNKGIELAEGDWLYFMGSDDELINNDILKEVSDQFRQYDVIYGNVYSDRFNGNYDGEFNYVKLIERNICHQSIFLKKEVFKKVGYFNLKYKSHADWDHNIRWFYSKEIKNKYVELIIANYADGGYSSLNDDLIFKRDKNLILFVKGMKFLPKKTLRQLAINYFKERFKF